jgi:hypothetical protein
MKFIRFFRWIYALYVKVFYPVKLDIRGRGDGAIVHYVSRGIHGMCIYREGGWHDYLGWYVNFSYPYQQMWLNTFEKIRKLYPNA